MDLSISYYNRSMAKDSEHIYLVTGGAGFVGSVIVRKLVAQQKKVHLLLKPGTNLWRLEDIVPKITIHDSNLLDLTSLSRLVKKIQPTVIYHLATRGAYASQTQVSEIFETNILGTWNLLTACASIPYHLFVNTGSSSEYGYSAQPMAETDHLEPNSWYAATKAAASFLVLQQFHQAQKPIVHLRLFSVYGPYEAPGRLFPTLLSRIFQNQALDLVAPETARDFIYVDDVVDLYLDVEALKKCVGQCLNVGRGQQVTLETVVETAFTVTGKAVQTNWQTMAPRSWDTSTWQANMEKTFKLLTWRPTTSLFDGITKMWKWFPAAADTYKE